MSSGLFLTLFHISMGTKRKIRAINTAVRRQPRFSGSTSNAMSGTMANVPTEKPNPPMDIARLLFLSNQLFMITVIGIHAPRVDPSIITR